MKVSKYITVLFLVAISLTSTAQSDTQTIDLSFKKENASYLSISELKVGIPHYYDDMVDDYNAGFVYRIIIVREEIYYSIYIERLILDIEGGVRRIEWSRKLEFNKLLEVLKLSNETTEILGICWIDSDTLTFNLDKKKILFDIYNADRVKVEVK